MAPKIPKGFGSVKGGKKDANKSGPSQQDRARQQKKAPSRKPPSSSPKRKHVVDLTEQVDDRGKRPRNEDAPSSPCSLALSKLGPLASVFVKDEEVKEWEAMNLEEATKASIRASAQVMLHSLGQINKLCAERARLTQLEGSNTILQKQLRENEIKRLKELKSKEADNNFLRNEIKEQEDMLNVLNEKFNKQEDELTTLKARLQFLEDQEKNGWPEEKEKLEDTSFEKGFNFYLTGFLANDPEYSWEKFGAEAQLDIENFKVSNADAIKAKRIELGLEEDLEDAPGIEQVEAIQPESNVIVPEKDNIEDKDAPSDGASATPPQAPPNSPTEAQDAP